MAGRARGEMPAAVRRLGKRLEAYRSKPDRQRRLPAALWKSAAELAREHGVSYVSRALRLDYTELRERAEAGRDESGPEKPAAAEKFIPVDTGIPLWSAWSTIEMEDGSGKKMTVRTAQPADTEVVELAKAFWRASS